MKTWTGINFQLTHVLTSSDQERAFWKSGMLTPNNTTFVLNIKIIHKFKMTSLAPFEINTSKTHTDIYSVYTHTEQLNTSSIPFFH